MTPQAEILAFPLGFTQTNSYVVRCGESCWVIDPGFGPGRIVDFLRGRKLRPERIVLTHGHCDHIAGINELQAGAGPVPICCPAGDAGMLTDAGENLSLAFGVGFTTPPADELLHPGQTLPLGELAWQVLDTSGHTPGGISLYCCQAETVFTGDALFADSIGRCDFPGGDLGRLLGNIQRKLLSLPEQTKVYPGHGPATTIGQEKAANPYLQEMPPN
jgi:hydroxyacylglutathione hydrolase